MDAKARKRCWRSRVTKGEVDPDGREPGRAGQEDGADRPEAAEPRRVARHRLSPGAPRRRLKVAGAQRGHRRKRGLGLTRRGRPHERRPAQGSQSRSPGPSSPTRRADTPASVPDPASLTPSGVSPAQEVDGQTSCGAVIADRGRRATGADMAAGSRCPPPVAYLANRRGCGTALRDLTLAAEGFRTERRALFSASAPPSRRPSPTWWPRASSASTSWRCGITMERHQLIDRLEANGFSPPCRGPPPHDRPAGPAGSSDGRSGPGNRSGAFDGIPNSELAAAAEAGSVAIICGRRLSWHTRRD